MKNKKCFMNLIAVIALFAYLSASAGYNFENAAYAETVSTFYDTTPGISVYELLDENISVCSGGWRDEFFLPFDAKNIVFSYTSLQNANILLKINSDEYNIILPEGSSEYIFDFPVVLRHNDIVFEMTSDAELEVSQITFNKVNVIWKAPFMRELPSLTQFEQDISTAVIFSMDSPIIMVNGSKRYIDYDNITCLPKSIYGNIYLPVKTLSRAIGIYYEDYPELTYILMRSKNLELKASGNICTVKERGASGDGETMANPFVYVNAEAYAPVRKICEMLGKTVIYNNGIVIIEASSNRARRIAENVGYTEQLAEVFESFAEGVQGTVYYVAQSDAASDSNSGTEQEPFKTLQKACEIAKAGDTVIIREGVYREALSPKNNGVAGAPIVFRAMEGENVTVSAFDVLEGFEEVTSEDEYYNADVRLYKAAADIDLGYTRNFILYNGSELVQGRYPNNQTNEYAYPWPEDVASLLYPTKGNIKVKSKYCNTTSHKDFRVYVSDTDLNQCDDYWKGATFVGEIERGWALTSGKIAYSTEGKIKLDNSTISFSWNQFGKDYGSFASDYGYITDSVKTVDIPGEWQLESGYLYICPPVNETAESLSVEIKARQTVIDVKDNSFINIENINTSGGGVCMDNSVMCVINGGSMKYLSHFVANNDASQCFLDGTKDDWNTEPDNYLTRGELGICIGGTDCAVLNTKIDYSAAAGILLYGKYAYIENNLIQNTGYGGAYYSGIFCTSEGYEPKSTARGGYYIYNNTVKNTGRASFCMTTANYKTGTEVEYEAYSPESDRGQFMPCEIAYNYFYNSNLIARDSGAYYIHGNNSGNDIAFTKLHHNIICNVQGNDNISDYFQPFACESYFYDDAWVAGINEYNNIGFATNERQSYTSNEPVTRGSEWAELAANSNNVNAGIIPGGKEGLTADLYPEGEPFFAGVFEKTKRFLLNYCDYEVKIYDLDAKAAVLSSGANLVKGKAELINNEYAEFTGAELANQKNRLIIHYTGDRYDKPKFKVTIGTSEYIVEADCSGYDTDYECLCYLDIEETGTYNIRITKIAGGKFALCGIDIIEDSISRVDNSNYIIGGAFDDFETGSMVQEPLSKVRRNRNLIDSYNYNYAYNLFINPTLIYKDIKTDEFDSVEISLQLDEAYDGTGIQLYMDSPVGEPVLEASFSGTDWADFQIYRFNLDNTFEAGTHDYYVKITGASNSTMNLYYIKFYKKDTAQKDYEPDYQQVNFAVGAKEITTDGTLSNGNLINLIDNSNTTYAACSSANYVQLNMGREYTVSSFEIIQDFRTSGYILQASNDGESFIDVAIINKEDAELISGTGHDSTDVYLYSGSCEEDSQSYRYYRIKGNSAAVMKIYDIKLYTTVEESLDGYREVNILEQITPSHTVSEGGSIVMPMERLYDTDLTTYAIVSNTEFVEFDLGNLYDLTALKFVYQGRNNCGYRICASPDGENYDTLYFAPRIASGITQYSNKVYIDKQKYRYVRIENINFLNQTVNNIFYGLEFSVFGLVPKV